MNPTQRKAMEDARNALQRAAYTTDRPEILGLCEQAGDALRAALAESDCMPLSDDEIRMITFIRELERDLAMRSDE